VPGSQAPGWASVSWKVSGFRDSLNRGSAVDYAAGFALDPRYVLVFHHMCPPNIFCLVTPLRGGHSHPGTSLDLPVWYFQSVQLKQFSIPIAYPGFYNRGGSRGVGQARRSSPSGVQEQSPGRESGDFVPQNLKQNVKLVYNF